MHTSRNRTVKYCLAIVGISWIVVGILRDVGMEMIIRHVIQALPLFLALVVLRSRPSWMSSISVALFLGWLAGMFVLWNSWRRLVEANSHFIFPVQEAVLSSIIASVATFGVLRAAVTGSDIRLESRLALIGTALTAQLAAMILGALVS
jgi:hypothetical protein